MALQRYCEGKRMVVLHPGTSAYDAARALDANHVGAVVVEDAGRVVGIVTDRDLAVRVTGSGVDPRRTPLLDVMTPEPETLSVDDSEERALALMREQHIRRVPIQDQGGVIGMVTLDDLILTGRLDPQGAAEVVAAQLAEPSQGKAAGPAHPMQGAHGRSDAQARHAARAQQTLHRFAERVRQDLGTDLTCALSAFEIVAAALIRRVTPAEAQHLAAQLPSELSERLLALPAGPDLGISRTSIIRELAARLGLDQADAARLFARVTSSLRDFITPGELDHLMAQLPEELKR